MNSQDTLYDITAIPYFPYVPGLRDWLIIAALLLCCLLIPRLYSAFSRLHLTRRRAFWTVAAEIETVLQTGPVPALAALSRVSLLVRRYLSLTSGNALLAFTVSELLAFKDSSVGALRDILMNLIMLESFRYQPADAAYGAAELKTLLASLRTYEAELKEGQK